MKFLLPQRFRAKHVPGLDPGMDPGSREENASKEGKAFRSGRGDPLKSGFRPLPNAPKRPSRSPQVLEKLHGNPGNTNLAEVARRHSGFLPIRTE
jgi:hypothetical protein